MKQCLHIEAFYSFELGKCLLNLPKAKVPIANLKSSQPWHIPLGLFCCLEVEVEPGAAR